MLSAEQADEAKSQAERAEAESSAAAARTASAEVAIKLALDELDHLRVVAPFDGVVTRRYVEVGEPVAPGQPVIEIMDARRLYVSAPIDERDAGRLAPGLPARVTIDTYPGEVWHGRVSRVAPMVEEARDQNRTIDVEVELPFDPSRPQARPGMTADIQVILARRDSVLRVPTLALIEGRRVLRLERGRAVGRDVTTGLRNWDWTEIVSGLAPGDPVITSLDRPRLKAGVAVSVREPVTKSAARGPLAARP
jgi:HlyD family secretion protein